MNRCMRSLKPANAAVMLANTVSPPRAGTSFAQRMVAIGGSARNVSSECQMSVPNGGVASSLRNLISTGAVPSFGANGCTVSSPNCSPKAMSASDEMFCSRKTMTSCSASASSTAASCSGGSGRLRSTPRISAPRLTPIRVIVTPARCVVSCRKSTSFTVSALVRLLRPLEARGLDEVADRRVVLVAGVLEKAVARIQRKRKRRLPRGREHHGILDSDLVVDLVVRHTCQALDELERLARRDRVAARADDQHWRLAVEVGGLDHERVA